MGTEEDEPLRLNSLDEVCRGILVAIDKVIIVVFSVIVSRFFTYHNIPTVKKFKNILRNVSPSMVVFASGKLWDGA